MEANSGAVALDDAQVRVVEADADARQVVIAGAGQGKTEVVAARLAHLIAYENLSASLDLLVLSFSRAAVHAVRTRLSERECAEVNVRTFDSFAGQLLLDANVEPAGDFDRRIRQATQLLRESIETPELIVDLRHIVIDEVQDLVGDRAEFVLAILDHLDSEGGFTVLGDPLQGIYDFVLEKSESRMSFDDFFERINTAYGAERLSLEKNYRARSEDCRRIAVLAAELRDLRDSSKALARLTEFENSLDHLDDVRSWDFLRLYAGRSAVLCRSNREVLLISRELTAQGIGHAIRRPAQSFGAVQWIAPTLDGLAGPIVPRSEVEAALAEYLDGVLDVEDAWYLLKCAEGYSRNPEQLNLQRIRSSVRSESVPLFLTQGDSESVIVSTIHRAKGLEFDNVFIVDPAYDKNVRDVPGQVRSRYVALSRARDNVVIVNPKMNYSYVKEFAWLPSRLQERKGRKGKSWARAIEFKGTDVYIARPAGAGAADARSLQKSLGDSIPGQGVNGEIDIGRSGFDYPIYALMQGGRTIGRTTEEFGECLVKAFNLKPGAWPKTIDDLLLVSVESCAGDPRFTDEVGLGPGGFWLIPRIVGLVRPVGGEMKEPGLMEEGL